MDIEQQALLEVKILQIKNECFKRIINKYPLWKQQNIHSQVTYIQNQETMCLKSALMMMMNKEILNQNDILKTIKCLKREELDIIRYASKVKSWIDRIRQRSNSLETYISEYTTFQELSSFDASDERYWGPKPNNGWEHLENA